MYVCVHTIVRGGVCMVGLVGVVAGGAYTHTHTLTPPTHPINKRQCSAPDKLNVHLVCHTHDDVGELSEFSLSHEEKGRTHAHTIFVFCFWVWEGPLVCVCGGVWGGGGGDVCLHHASCESSPSSSSHI